MSWTTEFIENSFYSFLARTGVSSRGAPTCRLTAAKDAPTQGFDLRADRKS